MPAFGTSPPALHPGTPVYPGDTPCAALEQHPGPRLRVNVGALTLSTHLGAHADAPLHYDPRAPPWAPWRWSPSGSPPRGARRGNAALVQVADLAHALATRCPRACWCARECTCAAHWDADFVPWPRPAAAPGRPRPAAGGRDTPAWTPADSTDLPSHQVLRQRGLRVLENLVLDAVPEGDYELIALPLKLSTADASPRAPCCAPCDPAPPPCKPLLDAIAAAPCPPRPAVSSMAGRPAPGCEGWALDAYPPVWVFTSFEPADDPCWSPCTRPRKRWPHWHLAPHCTGCTSATTRSNAKPAPWQGQVPEPACGAGERRTLPGACVAAEPRPVPGHGRRPPLVQRHAAQHPACACSTCFAYTCALVAAAQAGGPGGQRGHGRGAPGGGRNHRLNGLEAGALFWDHDIFSSWGKITRHGPHTAWSSSTRPATRKAASSPPRTTRACCAACPTCWSPAATPCCALNAPNWTAPSCASRCRNRRPHCNSSSAWPTPPPLPTPSPSGR